MKIYHRSIEIGEITQKNLHAFIPYKVSSVADMLMSQLGYSMTEAIKAIYSSNLYKKLSLENTKYWHFGPVDLFCELRAELADGRIVS